MHLRCYGLAAGGSVNRVHLGTGTAEGRARDATLKVFDYVVKAMEHEQCSTYSKRSVLCPVVVPILFNKIFQ